MKLRTRLFKIARYVIGFIGMLYTMIRREYNEIVILMYHRVNDDVNKGLAVKKDSFRWQMDYLKENKFKVISMNEAYNRILSNTIDGKYIVLTFDDGYEDYYNEVFPILEKYNFPSILYIIPGYVESGKVLWWDKDLGESKLMGWEKLQSLNQSSLIDFGSHTLNHIDLNIFDNQKFVYEMEMSKQILEEKLNRKITHFAYPRGIYSEEAEKVIGEFYNTGVLIYNGEEINNKINPRDLLRLKRTPVQNSDSKFMFIARIKGWLKLEEKIRKKLGIN